MTRHRFNNFRSRLRDQLKASTLERDLNYFNALSAAAWCRRNGAQGKPWFAMRFREIRKESR